MTTFTTTFTTVTTQVLDMLPMSGDACYFIFFVLGFVLFRTEALQKLFRRDAPGPEAKEPPEVKDQLWSSYSEPRQAKAVETAEQPVEPYTQERLWEDMRQRRYQDMLSGWMRLDAYTGEALSLVIAALMALGRPNDVGRFVAKVLARLPQLQPSLGAAIAAVASPPCEVPSGAVSAALCDILGRLGEELDTSSLEALLEAFAGLNDEHRVSGLIQKLAARGTSASPQALAGVVAKFSSRGNIDAALGFLQVLAAEHAVPRELAVAVVRGAIEVGTGDVSDPARSRAWDALDVLDGSDLPAEALLMLLEWAARQAPADVAMAMRIEGLLRAVGLLPQGAHEALVRAHAGHAGDTERASGCFDEFASAGRGPSEASLIAMISACVEAKNTALAEHILGWARKQRRCTPPVFAAGVKVLAGARQPERICALYEAAAAEGMRPDDALCGQLMKFAVQAGQLSLAHRLFNGARNPDSLNYMSLIRACGQERNVPQALEMLRELSDRGAADTAAYNCTLDVCVSCGDGAAADSVFEMMKNSGHVDVVSYNTLLKQHVGEGASSANAEALLKEMRQRGVKPNTATYNSLLGQALAAGDLPKAWRIVDAMEGSDVGVDAYTVAILFKGFRREGNVMDAESVDRGLSLIRKYNVRVDEVLVNSTLEACVRLRDVHRLTAALNTFKRSGWAMPKECAMTTSGMLIKAYGQSRQLHKVWQLWQEAGAVKGAVASEQLYGQMIDALVTNGCLDDALAIFREMKEVHSGTIGSQGFSVAYAMVIRGFAQRRECVRAMDLYEEMKNTGTKVSLVVFNTLVDACSRVGDMEKAALLFRDMGDTGCMPDLITYSTLIKGYCICGDIDQAMQLFMTMRKKGIRPDAIVYNSLLDGCAKKQMRTLCEQVVRDMVDAGVSPSNHSVSILVKLYGRCRDLEAAFKVVNELPIQHGFKANAAVYTCLMSSCIQAGRLDEAMDLRLRMVQEQTYPDQKTYSTLLRGTLRAGSVELSSLLIHAALDQDCRGLLDEELVQASLVLIQRRRLWCEHGRLLLDRLVEAGLPVHMPPAEAPRAPASSGAPVPRGGRGEFRVQHAPPRRQAPRPARV